MSYLIGHMEQHNLIINPNLFQDNIWKTVELGGRSKERIIADIAEAGIVINDQIKEAVNNDGFRTLSGRTKAKLHLTTVKDMTGLDEATFSDLVQAIKLYGLPSLPDEAAFDILETCHEQLPDEDWCVVLSHLLISQKGEIGLFALRGGRRMKFIPVTTTKESSVLPGSTHLIIGQPVE